jgi:hypothetical protein
VDIEEAGAAYGGDDTDPLKIEHLKGLQFGNKMAILGGDFLLASVCDRCLPLPPPILTRLSLVLVSVCARFYLTMDSSLLGLTPLPGRTQCSFLETGFLHSRMPLVPTPARFNMRVANAFHCTLADHELCHHTDDVTHR